MSHRSSTLMRGLLCLLSFTALALSLSAASFSEENDDSPRLEKRDHENHPRQLFGLPWGVFNLHDAEDEQVTPPLVPAPLQTEVLGDVLSDGVHPEGLPTSQEQPIPPLDPAQTISQVPGESVTATIHPEEHPTGNPPVPDGGQPPAGDLPAPTSLVVEASTATPLPTVVADEMTSVLSEVSQLPPATSITDGDHQESLSEIIHSVTGHASSVESGIEQASNVASAVTEGLCTVVEQSGDVFLTQTVPCDQVNTQIPPTLVSNGTPLPETPSGLSIPVSDLASGTQPLSTLWPTGSAPASSDAASTIDPGDGTPADTSQSPSDAAESPLSHTATFDTGPGQVSTTTITPTDPGTSVADPVQSTTDLQPHTASGNAGESTLWPTGPAPDSAGDDRTHTLTASVPGPGQETGQPTGGSQQEGPSQTTTTMIGEGNVDGRGEGQSQLPGTGDGQVSVPLPQPTGGSQKEGSQPDRNGQTPGNNQQSGSPSGQSQPAPATGPSGSPAEVNGQGQASQGEDQAPSQPGPGSGQPSDTQNGPEGTGPPPQQHGTPQQESPQEQAAGAADTPASPLEPEGDDADAGAASHGQSSPIAARSGGTSPAGANGQDAASAGPSPCPACPIPSCPSEPTPEPDPRQGPCPGRGYSCAECLNGWFCPPEQTPIQRAPCGYGWPCYHCSGGWYCAPGPTPSPEVCPPSGPSIVTATVTTTFVPSTPGGGPNGNVSNGANNGQGGPGGNGNGAGNGNGNGGPSSPGSGTGDGDVGSSPGQPGSGVDGTCTGANCPSGSGNGAGANGGNGNCTGANCPGGPPADGSNGPNGGGDGQPPDAYGGPNNGGRDPDSDGLTARAAPEAGGWKYLGCFNDTPGRTIDCDPNDWYAGNMTNAKCVAYCNKKGYKLAGTEYSRECWCGNVFQNAKRLPDIQCDMVCDGDSADVCGGDWALTVYSRDGTAANTITQDGGSHEGKVGGKQARDNAEAPGYGEGNAATSKPPFTPTTVFLSLSTSAESRPTTFFTAAEPDRPTASDTETEDDENHILSVIQSMLEAIPSDLGLGDDWSEGPADDGPGSSTEAQERDDSHLERRSESYAGDHQAVQRRSGDRKARPHRLTKEWRA